MKINLITKDNGVGLTQDVKIVRQLLPDHECTFFDVWERKCQKADINIFFELINDYHISFAKVNLFFPNPEWFWFTSQVNKMDLVMAKTRDAEEIFKRLKCPTVYTSFTSEDRQQPQKKERVYLHTAGQSDTKGSKAVFNSWKEEYPPLVFSKMRKAGQFRTRQGNIYTFFERMDYDTFLKIQNKCYFHLCPSTYEGFGHYIWEAKSCGGIVITTDGEPMRHFVTEGVDGFLVKGRAHKRMNFAITTEINHHDLQDVIDRTLKLTDKQLVKMSKASRAAWEENDRLFTDIFTNIINTYESRI